MKTVLIKKNKKDNEVEIKHIEAVRKDDNDYKIIIDNIKRTLTYNQLKNKLVMHDRALRGKEFGKILDLSGMVLSNKNLTGMNLSYSKLIGVDFRGAILIDVNFYCANLMGSDFRGVNLINVNFKGANIKGVIFDKKIFNNIKNYNISFFMAYRPEGLEGYEINKEGFIKE